MRSYLFAALLLSAAPAGAAPTSGGATRASPAPAPTHTSGCRLEYRRADTMWADRGQPTANPGLETLMLPAGGSKVFITDWKYEKTRNDGTTYYGSHMRLLWNRGTHPVRLLIRGWDLNGLLNVVQKASDVWYSTMPAGTGPWLVRADLTEAYCVLE